MRFLARLFDGDVRAARAALFAVTLVGVLIRLPYLTSPIADRHSWNQASTATVIRNFADKGGWPGRPEWDVLDPGPATPNIEAEEAPIYSGASAALYRWFGESHAWPRLLSILAMAVGGLYLFRLAGRVFGPAEAAFATLFFHLGPYPWFFGRTVMSDPWMLAATVAAAERFQAWLGTDRARDLAAAAIWLSLAGLFKAYALCLGLLFAAGGLAFRGFAIARDRRFWAAAIVAALPPLAWIVYASRVGSLGNVLEQAGDPFVTAQHLFGDPALLTSGKFWATIQSRLFDRMMTPVVTIFALASLIFADTRRRSGYVWLWLAALGAYVLIIRSGNAEHNYYQLPFAAPWALLAGAGLVAFARKLANRIEPARLATAVAVAFVALSAVYVRAEYRRDLSSVVAGETARNATEPGDLLLVLDPGSTRKNQAIYQAHRRGWHVRRLTAETLEQYRAWGATAAVVCVSPDQIEASREGLAALDMKYTRLAVTSAFGDDRPHTIAVYSLRDEK
ncbi:glycosyltransferase family 39 protein [bacterium]|nr:glycosyltransferase family 39 protein [bacterium]